MKNKLITCLFMLFFQQAVNAQINCASPLAIDICPSVYLPNQSNGGMLDDAPINCNISGEDLVYEIYAPQNALHIFVSLINSTGPSKITLNSGNCFDTICNSYAAPAGNSSFSFTVSPSNYYYLWIDAGSTIEFDISIGGDTAIQIINIPNTQGVLSFDNCAANPFKIANPFFEVEFNNVYQTNPMTLAPLNIFGQMCISVYLKNTSGVSGAKTFQFIFDPLGYDSVSSVDTLIPGFYNSGSWRSAQSGASTQFVFTDSLGLNRGDFTGSPDSCLKYEFCFNIKPKSNDPNLTNVLVNIYSDSYGAGFTGSIGLGCCPVNYSNCLGPFGSSSGGQAGLSFGFDDPGGGSLPVELISFDAKINSTQVLLSWTTATEINNDYFSLEKSVNNVDWIILSRIEGSGNSSIHISYSAIDPNLSTGNNYYRLKQTDFDGKVTLSDPIMVNFKKELIQVYPNPTKSMLYVKLPGHAIYQLSLYNLLGEKVKSIDVKGDGAYPVNDLIPGIYFLNISQDEEPYYFEKIIIQAITK